MYQFQKPKLFPALIGFLFQLPEVDSSLGELASNYLTIKFQQSFPNKTVLVVLDGHLINSLLEALRTLGCNQFVKLKVDYIKFGFQRLISSLLCYPSFNFKLYNQQIILFINIIIMNKIFPINSKFSPFLVQILAYKISVYEGISPSLLATMSLSTGVKGNTNEELINSLVKSNVIRNKTLEAVMKKVDRKHFISPEFLKKNENFYQNKPHKISGGQNMTDIFTHAVILQEACFRIEQLIAENQKVENTLKVLDIGTGHGYLAFVLSLYLAETLKLNRYQISHQVIGIDTNIKAIQYSEALKNKLTHSKDSIQKINFQAQTLQDKLKTEEAYDVIIGGFYMPPSLHDNLLNKLEYSSHQNQRNTCGIWPTDSQSGQSLYSFICTKDQKQDNKIIKNQMMSTMFSMPVVKTGVSKYFFEDGQQTQNENSIKEQTVNQDEVRQQLKILKMQKNKEQKEKIKSQLKQRISYYSLKLNKKLSLDEMKKIPEINILLQKLNQK